MTDPDASARAARWDQRHAAAPGPGGPARVLTDWAHLLPTRGAALDLACGLGGSALWLAGRGLAVTAWDRSPVAIERLACTARERGLGLTAAVRDLVADPPPPLSFDVIVVAHFLERDLAPAIAAALRPGGLLFYQTFTREAVSGQGPGDPAYRLAPNELLRLFSGLIVRGCRDEGRVGDLARGVRDLALLVAERPRTAAD